MSEQAISELVERATNDVAFRQRLLTDPIDTLKEFDLTDEERELLSNLDDETFDEFAGGLGDRQTQGRWIPGTG